MGFETLLLQWGAENGTTGIVAVICYFMYKKLDEIAGLVRENTSRIDKLEGAT